MSTIDPLSPLQVSGFSESISVTNEEPSPVIGNHGVIDRAIAIVIVVAAKTPQASLIVCAAKDLQ
jgi:hypothetical protein